MAQETLPNTLPSAVEAEFNRLNGTLKDLLRPVFGDKAELRIVDPKSLCLLKVNAHYMPKPTFDQLTANVGEDGFLASIPLCHIMPDGKLEVLSGNHRVSSAIEAKLAQIIVLVIPKTLGKSKKTAIQLSHNALVGKDDSQILKTLWDDIDQLSDKLYSGLDSKVIDELDAIDFSAFNAAQVKSEKVVLWFVPEEVESLDALLDEGMSILSADKIYLAPIAKYDELFRMLVSVKSRQNIKNTAVAFMFLIEQMKKGLARIEADEAAEAAKMQPTAPPEGT